MLPDGTQAYKVETWSPPPRNTSPSQLGRVSAIDLMEREYEQEYARIAAKDKSLGKDFNNAAYEHLKLAKYEFQYLRLQESLYSYE